VEEAAVMPRDDDDEFEALETDVYDADDQPEGESHTTEADALRLAPLSDQSARDLIIDEEP
jgi:hypothetical protein